MITTTESQRITRSVHVRDRRLNFPNTSLMLWMLVWLLAVDAFFGWARPLHYLQIAGAPFDQDDQVDKVQELFSPLCHFNTLILGSSLAVYIGRADLLREDSVSAYTGASYCQLHALDKTLSERLHVSAKTFNLGVVGGMVDEYLGLWHKVLSVGKKPKFLLVLLAPRDFIDNNTREDSLAINQLTSNVLTWLNNLRNKHLSEVLDTICGQVSSLYRCRATNQLVLELAACQLFHRAPNLYQATKFAKFNFNDSVPTLEFRRPRSNKVWLSELVPNERWLSMETKYYKTAYRPLNYKKLALQMRDLNQLLEESQGAGVNAVVVNMPLSAHNFELLPQDFRRQYRRDLANICASHHMKFINFLETGEFQDADYIDGTHLTPQGALKFINLLCDRLSEDAIFKNNLLELFRR